MSQSVRASSCRRWKRLALLSLLLVLLSSWPAFAQRSLGYGFVGGTIPRVAFGNRTNLRYGIGGAAGVSQRVAICGEIGGIHSDSKWAVGSVGIAIHLRSVSRSERVDPFVTGGLSVAHVFAGRHQNGRLVNVGTGLHYWFRPRLGVRTEAKLNMAGEAGHAEVRLGIAFR